MPFIHVKSLPFRPPRPVSAIVRGLTHDFAEGTGMALEHVTATWEFLPPGHYAVAGKSARRQTATSHPVLVDILAPDLNGPKAIESMLQVVATSIARHTKVPVTNIFINYRRAQSGSVFDAGTIVRW